MKQHLPGPEPCPHQCGATAEILPPLGDRIDYRCPKCGAFSISGTVDEHFKGPGHFRTDETGRRWRED